MRYMRNPDGESFRDGLRVVEKHIKVVGLAVDGDDNLLMVGARPGNQNQTRFDVMKLLKAELYAKQVKINLGIELKKPFGFVVHNQKLYIGDGASLSCIYEIPSQGGKYAPMFKTVAGTVAGSDGKCTGGGQ